jgi:hypothetical protein
VTRPRSRAVWLPVLAYLAGTLAVPACNGALGNAEFEAHAITVTIVVAACVAARLLGARAVRALAARASRLVI